MSVRILEGDCRNLRQWVEPASIDCVIADPPYGETSLSWDQWPAGWLEALREVMRPTGSIWVFGSLRMFMAHSDEFRAAGWKLAQEIIWEKHNGTNSSNDRFRRVHECAAQFYSGDWASVYKKPLFSADALAKTVRRKTRPQQWGSIGDSFYESADGGPRLLRSVWCARSEHGRALHPTQKPLAILMPLVEYSCPPGGVILDPTCGSGGVGIVANQTGRSAVLIELNPAIAAVARTRNFPESDLLAGAA